MKHCDVLIVGGGPAGSTCAWRLTQLGFDVIVLDKQPFPRDKVCAGWITPAVVEALRLDLDHYAEGRTLQPISAFRTGSIKGGGGRESRFDEPVSYGIRRYEFDDYLLRRSGARLLLDEPLASLEREGAAWVVNGHIRTPLVVGAGGHFCPVARRLGNRPGQGESVVAAQEAELELRPEQWAACTIAGDTPELFFCEDLKGYAWALRKGNFLNIGLGREGHHRLGEQVLAFVERLKRDGRIPQEIAVRFKGHAYLLYAHTPRRIVADGALLIGDAAGLAYPQSGEGIRPAVESALIAAEVIAAADEEYDARVLDNYERRLTARFGSRRPMATRRRPWLPETVRRQMGRLLLSNRWFARNVVVGRWFLHEHQAPLG